MGRWIDWHVSQDLTAAEVEALAAVVNGPLREALPLVARRISSERPTAPNLMSRLAFHYKDRETAGYAADPKTIIVSDSEIKIAGSDDGRGLDFGGVAGQYSGHTVGFQDYVSIGVLAAASQVSGKVKLTGGDSIDRAYVAHLLQRITDAGSPIKPTEDFASSLPIEEDA
jgi:hypothetical protein